MLRIVQLLHITIALLQLSLRICNVLPSNNELHVSKAMSHESERGTGLSITTPSDLMLSHMTVSLRDALNADQVPSRKDDTGRWKSLAKVEVRLLLTHLLLLLLSVSVAPGSDCSAAFMRS